MIADLLMVAGWAAAVIAAVGLILERRDADRRCADSRDVEAELVDALQALQTAQADRERWFAAAAAARGKARQLTELLAVLDPRALPEVPFDHENELGR